MLRKGIKLNFSALRSNGLVDQMKLQIIVTPNILKVRYSELTLFIIGS